jgi:hypothetical protein
MEAIANETLIEERLPWHKPEVQLLVINIDTRTGGGSGIDLVNGENP